MDFFNSLLVSLKSPLEKAMGQVDYQVARFRHSLWRLMWLRWSVRALVIGFWVVGCAVVAARLLWHLPAQYAALGLLPLGLLIALGAWAVRKRLPSPVVIRAEIDKNSRAHGLVMAGAEVSLGAWESQITEETLIAPKVAWSFRRALGGLLAAGVFAAATLLVPDSWLAEAADTKRFDVAADVNRLEEKVKVLEELSVMPEEEAETVRANLKQVEKRAAGDDPAKTLEALDHVENRLEQLAENEAAQAAEAARTGSELAAAAKALEHAANRMSPEVLEQMMKELAEVTKEARDKCEAADRQAMEQAGDKCEDGLSADELGDLADCLGNCAPAMQGMLQQLGKAGLIDPNQLLQDCQGLTPEQLEALAEALAECEFGDADLEELLEACRLCLGNCPGGDCLLAGRPGRGGVTRGPGHAKLNFDGETDEHAESFENTMLAPGGFKKDGRSVLRSVGRGKPGQDEERAVSEGGGLAAGGGAGGAHTRAVLPSHRRVVREYFNREPSR